MGSPPGPVLSWRPRLLLLLFERLDELRRKRNEPVLASHLSLLDVLKDPFEVVIELCSVFVSCLPYFFDDRVVPHGLFSSHSNPGTPYHTPPSPEIMARHRHQILERPELLPLDRDRPVPFLEDAFDEEAGGADDELAVLLEEVRGDDGLGHAGLVLQGEEEEALGRARALADDPRAGGAHAVGVGEAVHTGGGGDPVPL